MVTVSESVTSEAIKNKYGNKLSTGGKQRLIKNIFETQVVDGHLYVVDTEDDHTNRLCNDYRNNVDSFGFGLKQFDYHLGEYPLLWENFRANVGQRVSSWNKQKQTTSAQQTTSVNATNRKPQKRQQGVEKEMKKKKRKLKG